jgi:acyl carrier protein
VVRELEPGHRHLVAYALAETGDIDLASLHENAKTRLPDFLVPREIVALDTLPFAARSGRAEGPSAGPVQDGASDYQQPRTARQRVLCTLFGEVLGVEHVGIEDSFFDLDGQSVLAVLLVGRINSALGVNITIADLFRAPTVADLDRRLELVTR